MGDMPQPYRAGAQDGSHGMSASPGEPRNPKRLQPQQNGERKQRAGGSRAGLGERLLLGEPGAVQTSPSRGDRAPTQIQKGPWEHFRLISTFAKSLMACKGTAWSKSLFQYKASF